MDQNQELAEYDGEMFILSDAWVRRRRPQAAIRITVNDIVEMNMPREESRFTPTARAQLGKIPENGYTPARIFKSPERRG